jgi:hypothetical protein
MDYKTLRSKKLIIKPIMTRSTWLKKGHDGEHSYSNTNKIFQAKQGANGFIMDPLEFMSEEEKNKFASEIRIKPEDLSVFNPTNIFTKHSVSINKNQKVIDCSDPLQFLDFLVLKGYPNMIRVPGGQERPTQIFEIVDQSEVDATNAQTVNFKLKASLALAKLEGNTKSLTNVLLVAGRQNIPRNATAEWLLTENYKLMEESPKQFIKILEDPLFDLKIFINDALNAKAIIKVGKDEYELNHSGSLIGNMKEVCAFFEKLENQEDRMIVQAQIDKSKGK